MTLKQFLLKKFPTHLYMDCPIPKHHWETIDEYAESKAKEFAEWVYKNYVLVTSNELKQSAWVHKDNKVMIYGSEIHFMTLIKHKGETIEQLYETYKKSK